MEERMSEVEESDTALDGNDVDKRLEETVELDDTKGPKSGQDIADAPLPFLEELTYRRIKQSRCLAIIAILFIVAVNGILLCVILKETNSKFATNYDFWAYLVRKVGVVSIDVAATYFGIRLLRIAERLSLPLTLDEARLSSLQGSTDKTPKITMSELVEILKGLLTR